MMRRNSVNFPNLWLLFGCVFLNTNLASVFVKGKVCKGINHSEYLNYTNPPPDLAEHYNDLKARYTNCTYVDGNLELTWLKNESLDLSFLQNIRNVSGYVAIYEVNVTKLVLPKLEIIQGQNTLNHNSNIENSLFVSYNNITTLEMPALKGILHGTILVAHNPNLCYMNTIIWTDILSSTTGVNLSLEYSKRECPPCDKACNNRCWGEGPENCQQLTLELKEEYAVHLLYLLLLFIVLFLTFMGYSKMRVGTSSGDNEYLHLSTVKPNMEQVKIIKGAEIRKGGVLGYGAFGTVFKGVLVPEGESVWIPVAIKALRDDIGLGVDKVNQLMDEAYMMASINHPNVLKLLAVCPTPSLMLVTRWMPMGSLLNFVRNNRNKLGPKSLLTWCTQIAKGMVYLEEKRLVHRDLAARNVLVESLSCVKITDFGLSKILNINEKAFKTTNETLPLKWLAPECFKEGTFSHKSDVWAFGVTIWELLTYGSIPYENIPPREVPLLIEQGERLSQPPICSLDLYMRVMLPCWMPRPEARLCFKQIEEEFEIMSRDPGRYLAIPSDKLLKLSSFTPDILPDIAVDTPEYDQPKPPRPVIPFKHLHIEPTVPSCHRSSSASSMKPRLPNDDQYDNIPSSSKTVPNLSKREAQIETPRSLYHTLSSSSQQTQSNFIGIDPFKPIYEEVDHMYEEVKLTVVDEIYVDETIEARNESHMIKLPPLLHKFHNLTELHLSATSLVTVPTWLCTSFTNLRVLDLSANEMLFLPASFQDLRNIERLNPPTMTQSDEFPFDPDRRAFPSLQSLAAKYVFPDRYKLSPKLCPESLIMYLYSCINYCKCGRRSYTQDTPLPGSRLRLETQGSWFDTFGSPCARVWILYQPCVSRTKQCGDI
ncbi:hypothetical protein WDU94_006843 [Cyamophila willieti]